MFQHTLLVLQLLLHTAKFLLGPSQDLLYSGHFRIMSGHLLCRRLFSHKGVYVINKGSCKSSGFDPLPGSLSVAGQCIRGYYSYYDDLSKVSYKTYLKGLYKAKAGLIQPAFGRLNLSNHRTHEGPMFIDDRRVL